MQIERMTGLPGGVPLVVPDSRGVTVKDGVVLAWLGEELLIITGNVVKISPEPGKRLSVRHGFRFDNSVQITGE